MSVGKVWGEIKVTNALQVAGRGLLLVTSVEAEAGDLVQWKGVTWKVKDVEGRKTGMIFVGEAGSSSPLDALEDAEEKRRL